MIDNPQKLNVGFSILFTSLVSALVVVWYSGFHSPKWFGWYLIALYVLCTVLATLQAVNVIG
jgi:hypothetical protein